MKEILDTEEYFNARLIKNNRIFAGCILFFQTAVIILYSFFVLPAPTTPSKNNQLLIVSGTAILILIGFGLHFSVARNKIWSTLGFNLLILAITFQLYFLASSFWHFVGIANYNSELTWHSRFPVYLTNNNNSLVKTYGLTAMQALKCSLANIIAFAAILGRAGPLQAFIMSIVGTFIYELNRQLISRWSVDNGGSMGIFCFAGFYGGIISIILYCIQRKTFNNHPLRVGSKFSFVLSGIGSLFCWVFFAFLNIDSPIDIFLNYYAGINTFYCISACVVMSISFSCIINGKLDFKDLIHSPIVGGVVIGSSSSVINSALSSLLLGGVAALIYILLRKLEMKTKWYVVVENHVHILFGLMGAFGGLISSLFLSQSLKDSMFLGYINNSYQDQSIGVGISIGIALVGGLMVCCFINGVNGQGFQDHYHDQSYWIIQQDGISNINHVQAPSQDSSQNKEELQSEQPKDRYFKKVLVSNGSQNEKENSEV